MQRDKRVDSMNHLLIDFDSKIPNLALMKISAYAKSNGDLVYLNNIDEDPDHIWLSAIFTWNKDRALSSLEILKYLYPNAVIHYGGTAFDWGRTSNRIELPENIEKMNPDYTLYNDDRAVGFCQRGCNRKCSFCDTWRKEGRIDNNTYRRLNEWVPDNFKKVLLLDNDIALAEAWKHDQVLNDAMSMGVKLSITQGYDIRCVTPERASLLAQNKPFSTSFTERMLYFSWDYIQNEKWVRKGIEILKDAGFKGRELTCYTIVGFNTTHEQDIYRAEILRNEYGILTYIMPYNNIITSQEMRNLRRWANKRQLYKSMDFPEYNMHFRAKNNGIVQEMIQSRRK